MFVEQILQIVEGSSQVTSMIRDFGETLNLFDLKDYIVDVSLQLQLDFGFEYSKVRQIIIQMQVNALLLSNFDLQESLEVHFGGYQHIDTHYCCFHPLLFHKAIVCTEIGQFFALYETQLLAFSAYFESIDSELKLDDLERRQCFILQSDKLIQALLD